MGERERNGKRLRWKGCARFFLIKRSLKSYGVVARGRWYRGGWCCVCSVCTKHLILATACTGFHVHAGRVCMCASPRWVQRGCCHGDRRPASAAVGATSQCPGSYLLIHPERQHTNQPPIYTYLYDMCIYIYISTWTR